MLLSNLLCCVCSSFVPPFCCFSLSLSFCCSLFNNGTTECTGKTFNRREASSSSDETAFAPFLLMRVLVRRVVFSDHVLGIAERGAADAGLFRALGGRAERSFSRIFRALFFLERFAAFCKGIVGRRRRRQEEEGKDGDFGGTLEDDRATVHHQRRRRRRVVVVVVVLVVVAAARRRTHVLDDAMMTMTMMTTMVYPRRKVGRSCRRERRRCPRVCARRRNRDEDHFPPPRLPPSTPTSTTKNYDVERRTKSGHQER